MGRILTKMFVQAKENENDRTVVSRSSQMLVKVPGPVLSSCDVNHLDFWCRKKTVISFGSNFDDDAHTSCLDCDDCPALTLSGQRDVFRMP